MFRKRTGPETAPQNEPESEIGQGFFLDSEVSMATVSDVEYQNVMIRSSEKGVIYVTTFRILFCSSMVDISPDAHSSIPLTSIEKIQKKRLTISVDCKDVRQIRFVFPSKDRLHHFLNAPVLGAFRSKSTDLSKELMFAFTQFGDKKNGFEPYTDEKELEHFNSNFSDFDKFWRLTFVNRNYEICDTYPKSFFVPFSLSDAEVIEVSKGRSRERLPVLSYVHSSGASIVRCAQPSRGLVQQKENADVSFMKHFMKTNPDEKASLVIADARPKINAEANRLNKGGYEDPSHYKNASLHFLNIDNIHAIRESHNKMKSVCMEDETGWFLSGVDRTQWLQHLSRILGGASLIAQAIVNGSNVLCHCSDGWDRTSQLSALALVLLDPYYRTFDGFLAVIEKEWIRTGHKFDDRVGHDPASDGQERSPIFLQFLECMWQIKQQQPTAFQFSDKLLLYLSSALYSCRFGTFLFNCEKQRDEKKLKEKTPCLWSFLNENRSSYLNPRYSRDNTVLKINYEMRFMRIWRAYYFQYISLGGQEKIDEEHFQKSEEELQRKEKGNEKKKEEEEKQQHEWKAKTISFGSASLEGEEEEEKASSEEDLKKVVQSQSDYIEKLVQMLKQNAIDVPERPSSIPSNQAQLKLSVRHGDYPAGTKLRTSGLQRNKSLLFPKLLQGIPPPLASVDSTMEKTPPSPRAFVIGNARSQSPRLQHYSPSPSSSSSSSPPPLPSSSSSPSRKLMISADFPPFRGSDEFEELKVPSPSGHVRSRSPRYSSPLGEIEREKEKEKRPRSNSARSQKQPPGLQRTQSPRQLRPSPRGGLLGVNPS